jgi:hypothetical protein
VGFQWESIVERWVNLRNSDLSLKNLSNMSVTLTQMVLLYLLCVGETDGSSYPNGGLRVTHRAGKLSSYVLFLSIYQDAFTAISHSFDEYLFDT